MSLKNKRLDLSFNFSSYEGFYDENKKIQEMKNMIKKGKEIEGSKLKVWKPTDKGESIGGKIIEILEGQYGNQYAIQQDDKTVIFTPSHKSLQGKMQKLLIGDLVVIEFDGELPPKARGENPSKMYKVFEGTN